MRTPVNRLKRGKTQVIKSRLVLGLHLIGREGGARFLDQSQSEVKQNQCNPGFGHSIENCSITIVISRLCTVSYLICPGL